MTTLQESVIDSPNWLSQVASKYLTIYIGELEKSHDWEYHIGILSSRLSKKYPNQDEMITALRKTIACAILLPVYDRKSLTDPPENLLYWCSGYRQYGEKDWYDLLYNVVKKDQEIIKWRNRCQSLGIIDPIDFSPITRQAFNWLYGAAQDSGVVTSANDERIQQSFQRLVWAYGGAVVCSLFQNHDAMVQKKVLNWRTNYFFERLIFDVFTVDQVVKIKRQELKKTNQRLVKHLKK